MIDVKAYSEVYEILKNMDKYTVMKIPIEILENIKNNRDKKYISKIEPNDLFNKNNISEKAIEIIAWIYVNYWAEMQEKEELKRKAREMNSLQEIIKKKNYIKEHNDFLYISDKKEKKTIPQAVTVYKSQNFIQRMFDFVKKILNRKVK